MQRESGRIQIERNGARKKPRASALNYTLDTAVFVIEGMTNREKGRVTARLKPRPFQTSIPPFRKKRERMGHPAVVSGQLSVVSFRPRLWDDWALIWHPLKSATPPEEDEVRHAGWQEN